MSIRVAITILSFGLILSGCASRTAAQLHASTVPKDTVVTPNETPPIAETTPNEAALDASDSQIDASNSQPREGCQTAAATAERTNGLPRGLLTAIAGAESGMRPTALRVGGRGVYPPSQAAAKAVAMRALSHSQSVMAGCMQVNLRVHDPKGELWALEPQEAADWAAGYLLRLHHRFGSWQSAISAYGGDRGHAYVNRIERRLDTSLPEEVAEAPP